MERDPARARPAAAQVGPATWRSSARATGTSASKSHLARRRRSFTRSSSASPGAAQPAALRRELGFRLVLTVWETIPLARRVPPRSRPRATGARRSTRPTSSSRRPSAPATRWCSRASPRERIEVVPAGDRRRALRRASSGAPRGRRLRRAGSSGRRATRTCCARSPRSRRGIVRGDAPRLLVVGSGPEDERLSPARAGSRVADLRRDARCGPVRGDAGGLRARVGLVLASLPTLALGGAVRDGARGGDGRGRPRRRRRVRRDPGGGRAAAARSFPPGDWVGLAPAVSPGRRATDGSRRARRRVLDRRGGRAARERLPARARRMRGSSST